MSDVKNCSDKIFILSVQALTFSGKLVVTRFLVDHFMLYGRAAHGLVFRVRVGPNPTRHVIGCRESHLIPTEWVVGWAG